MKNKLENPLPKMIRGSVHAQYVRCGKATCKCSRGELHGAYYYYFVRVGGRLKKRYLKASEVEGIKAACILRRELEKARRERMFQTWRAIREVRAYLRDYKTQID